VDDALTPQEKEFLNKNAGEVVEYKDAMPELGYGDFEDFRLVVERWRKADYVKINYAGGMVPEKEACFSVSILGAEDN